MANVPSLMLALARRKKMRFRRLRFQHESQRLELSMTTGDQTVLQWTYEPERFFEVPCDVKISGGTVSIKDGQATGRFDAKHYGDGRAFRDTTHAFLQQIFAAQQVQVHEAFALNPPGMVLRHADGRESAMLFADPLGRIDIQRNQIMVAAR